MTRVLDDELADGRSAPVIDLASLEFVDDIDPGEVAPSLLGGRLRYVTELSQGGVTHVLFEEVSDAAPLTSRASRALELMALGRSVKEIAFEIAVTPAGISNMVEGVRRTLGFRDRRQLRRVLAALHRARCPPSSEVAPGDGLVREEEATVTDGDHDAVERVELAFSRRPAPRGRLQGG